MLKPILFSFATLLSTASHAESLEFYGTAEAGIGRMEVSEEYTFENDDSLSGAGEFSLAMGTSLFDKITIELGYAATIGASILEANDSYDLFRTQALLGLRIPLGSGLVITPKIGGADWKLEGEEGAFLNPGEEDVSQIEGEDVVYAMEFEWPLDELVGIGFEQNWINTDFGNLFSMKFMAKFKF